MKCPKCGKKIVIPEGKMLSWVMYNPTGLCDDCFSPEEYKAKQEQKERAQREDWICETMLFKEIEKAFPGVNVIHHAKPAWIGRQHLDIWIPEWNIALEYRGIQHYEPLAIFGGENSYAKTLKVDKRQSDLCEKNGCKLILAREGYIIADVIADIEQQRNH
jgi:hypothetical protein